MRIVAFNADEANWLTEEDAQCDAKNCDQETEHIVRMLGTIWWAPVCDEHLLEFFEDQDEIPVVVVEDDYPAFTYRGGL